MVADLVATLHVVLEAGKTFSFEAAIEVETVNWGSMLALLVD